MPYVDGYVVPVPKKNVQTYAKMARAAGKIWMDNGAVQYFECVGDDLAVKFGLPFPKALKAKPGETVVFAWILFKSRAHRDRVNARVMKDPRMNDCMEENSMPFNPARMLYGGFAPIVSLS